MPRRPHRVASIAGTLAGTYNGVTNPTFAYDANGVMTSGAGRTVTATSFNVAASIVDGANTAYPAYDAYHARYKLVTSGQNGGTTYYLNDPSSEAMEEKSVVAGVTTWRDYILVEGRMAAGRFCAGAEPCASGGATLNYFVLDHLGSIAVITDAAIYAPPSAAAGRRAQLPPSRKAVAADNSGTRHNANQRRRSAPGRFDMFGRALVGALIGALAAGHVLAQTCAAYPNTLSNGATADANQVMANFNCAALLGAAHFTGPVDLGSATEKLSLNSGSLGFNRRTQDGYIYNTGAFAYQFQHFGSTTPASDYLTLQVYTPTSGFVGNALTVNGVGNVGITTTAPNVPLSLGNTGATIKFAAYDNGPNYLFGIGAINNNLTFGANITATGTPQMVLSGTGDVGIGTTTPTQTLVVNGNADVMANGAYLAELPNASTTGTMVNKLARLTGAPSTAVMAASTDTDGVVGVVVGGAGTTGAAQIAVGGQASCVFENATTAGDFVTIGSSTAGDCHDAGASRPASGQTLGRVLATVTAGSAAEVLVLIR